MKILRDKTFDFLSEKSYNNENYLTIFFFSHFYEFFFLIFVDIKRRDKTFEV